MVATKQACLHSKRKAKIDFFELPNRALLASLGGARRSRPADSKRRNRVSQHACTGMQGNGHHLAFVDLDLLPCLFLSSVNILDICLYEFVCKGPGKVLVTSGTA